ncbi:hypothetical protein [Aestuariivirga sp.]|uniref:hypothetical protein n=1 Tax=Aestuariivirga sp. TaxID=2650926 RepID=UPI003BAAAB92
MKYLAFATSIAVLALATPALATDPPPKFTASCPTGIAVKSGGKGKVRINGAKAAVKTFNANSWQASLNGVSIDIAKNGAELIVSYTGKGGANGICQVTSAPLTGSSSGDTSGVPAKDSEACLAAVSRKTNNPDVKILDRTSSEANNTVVVGVGPDKAKWRCLVKNGSVADVMSLTDEGAM